MQLTKLCTLNKQQETVVSFVALLRALNPVPTSQEVFLLLSWTMQSLPRLLAVPFWIVEREHEIAERKSRKLERTNRGGCGGGRKKSLSSSLSSFFLLTPVSPRCAVRLLRSGISRALSTIQKGTTSSLQLT